MIDTPNVLDTEDDYLTIVQKVEREVLRIAAENPEAKYEKPDPAILDRDFYIDEYGHDSVTGDCLYVHKFEDQAPVAGCIVGQAISNIGLGTLDQLRAHENVSASVVIRNLSAARLNVLNVLAILQQEDRIRPAQDTLDRIDAYQQRQDISLPFGEAVDLTLPAPTED